LEWAVLVTWEGTTTKLNIFWKWLVRAEVDLPPMGDSKQDPGNDASLNTVITILVS